VQPTKMFLAEHDHMVEEVPPDGPENVDSARMALSWRCNRPSCLPHRVADCHAEMFE
jgi:hypothetical protein